MHAAYIYASYTVMSRCTCIKRRLDAAQAHASNGLIGHLYAAPAAQLIAFKTMRDTRSTK